MDQVAGTAPAALSIFDLSDQLAELKDHKDRLDAALKEIKSEYDQVEAQLAQLMLDEETGSFKRGGLQFVFQNKFFANAEPEQKDKLLSTLKEKDTGLVYETVNANSLRSYVKAEYEANEDELPDWLQGLVKVGLKPSVSIRKAR